MSEKVTFQELIKSMANETDHSEQFTHDFLQDFVDVIHDGLENDGKVNIAGLGKFDLKRVDERKGYNPQTNEKMTIPAHNKLVFKPYKNIRELVNAPYAHLESELIEEENEDSAEETENNQDSQQDIPTGLPTPRDPEQSAKNDTDPFGFLDDENAPSSNFSLDEEPEEQENKSVEPEDDEEFEEDIVEFRRDSSGDSEEPEDIELDDFIRGAESSDKKEEGDDSQEQITSENEDSTVSPYAPNFEGSKQDPPENVKEEVEKPNQNNKKGSAFPIWTAAAGILLLLAAGAWFYGIAPQDSPPEMTAERSVSTSQDQSADRQGTQQTGNSKTNQKSSTQQSSQQNSQAAQPANEKEQNLSIEEGQTLWSIAEEKYGNPRLWPWIYDNNGSVENPDLIIAGNSLSLPLPSGPQNSLTTSDSVGVAKGYLSTYRWYKEKESPKARDHLWGAKHFHEEALNMADIKIDKADLSYAKNAR